MPAAARPRSAEFFLPGWQIPMAIGCCRGMVLSGEEVWRAVLRVRGEHNAPDLYCSRDICHHRYSRRGRRVGGRSNSSLPGEAVRTSTPLDGIKMMKNAKDLPEQRHRRCDARIDPIDVVDRSQPCRFQKKKGALSRERRRNDRAAPRGRRFPPSVALDQAPL